MGIPAFFRWLVEKYSNVIAPTKEPRDNDGSRLKCDFTQLNVNGEFDNLYLDMNGIIHPCAHPEKGPKPRNTQDMMDSIIEYLDLLFAIVRPRKLIYMAIDGVAPRAKMNQQRARRFRAALDSRITKENNAKDLAERLANGSLSQEDYDAIQKESSEKYHFDSNCITPGTEFMALVALTLRQYVAEKISTDPAWKNVKVIISDASVPGEGEHKIMEYIRHQRSQPDYDPNLKHVMYGLDADLIMLALSTHEVNFDILREFIPPPKRGKQQQQASHSDSASKEIDEDLVKDFLVKDYQLLNLAILREYLDQELKCNPPFEYNLERIIDDFIFICFFVGNDFLPHLPSLQINEGAIDRLMRIYKELLPTFEGYLTDNGIIDLDRLRKVFVRLSREEEDILLRRKQKEERIARGRQQQQTASTRTDITGTPTSLQLNNQVSEKHKQAATSILNDILQPVVDITEVQDEDEFNPKEGPKKKVKTGDSSSTLSNKDAAQQLRENLAKATSKGTKDQLDAANREAAALLQQKMSKYNEKKRVAKVIDIKQTPEASTEVKTDDNTKKRKKKTAEEEEEENKQEEDSLEKKLFINKMKDVNIGSQGWRSRYYLHHFETELTQKELVRSICQSYVDGLAWVLRYYFHGCCSWGWYYPFHYAPFILDLAENGSLMEEPQFELGAPFQPFQQLMSVLPKASGQFVPKPYRTLMGITVDGEEKNESILHFYPTEFLIDVAPGMPTWKGVCQLPFIDEKELLEALKPLDSHLTEDEAFRNSHGTDLIIAHSGTSIGSTSELPRELTKNDQILGEISPVKPDIAKRLPPLLQAKVFTYENPDYPNDYESVSGLLPGAIPQQINLEQYRTKGIQNSAANRMINRELDSNQYKNRNYGNSNFNNNYNNNNFNNQNYSNNNNYNNNYNNNNRNYNNQNNNWNNNQNNYNNNNWNNNNQNNYNNWNNNNNQNYNNNNWNNNNMGGNMGNYNNNQNYNNNNNNWNNNQMGMMNNNNNWNNNNNNNMGYNNNNMNYNMNLQQQQQQFQGMMNLNLEQKQTVLNNMMSIMKQYNEGANNMTPQEYNQMSTMMNMFLQQQQQDLQQVQTQFNIGRQTNNNSNHHKKDHNNNNQQHYGGGGNKNYNNQQGGGNKNYNNNNQQGGGNKNYNSNNQQGGGNKNYNYQQQQQQQQGGNKMKYNPFAKSKK